MNSPRGRLLVVEPRFRLFLAARALSWAGSAVTLVALPLLLYQRTQSPALTGLLTMVESLPYLLLGLPAGALVDRWRPRRVLVATSLGSAAVMASIPLASGFGILTTAQLMLAALLTSSLFVFFDAAGFGVVTSLVGRDRVASATSTMMSIYTVIGMAGPALGGAFAAAVGPAVALGVDAASYAVAAALLTRVRLDVGDTASIATDTGTTASNSSSESAGSNGSRGTALSAGNAGWFRCTGNDIRDGLHYVFTHPVIRALTLIGTGNSLTAGAVTGLMVVVAVQQLGMSDQDARIGMLFAAASVGSLLASLLLPKVQQRAAVGAITLAALAINVVAVVAWSSVTAFALALAVVALVQASTTLISMNGIIVRQSMTPASLQGRVNTTARMIAFGGQPIGAALGGLLAAQFGSQIALIIAALGVAVSLIAGWCSTLRSTPLLATLIESETADPQPR